MITEHIVKKTKKITKQKQIVMIALFLGVLLVFTTFIFIRINKNDKAEPTADIKDYLVTEYFMENSGDTVNNYEVRYYPEKQKSFLVSKGKNSNKAVETVREVKTEFRKECVKFTLDSETRVKVKDLSQYADDSGFIYTCKIDEVQEFLTREGVNGTILFTYGTPSYFECYFKKEAGEVMRGLLLYDSGKKTGTLIYKQCREPVLIPAATDLVTVIEENNQ